MESLAAAPGLLPDRANRRKGISPSIYQTQSSNFQRDLSLLGSNLANVGVLWPTAVRANGSLELGTALSMMR